jgi:hypothetical protein
VSSEKVLLQIKKHSLHFLLDLDLNTMQLDMFLSGIWGITPTKDDVAAPFLDFEDRGESYIPHAIGKNLPLLLESYCFQRMLTPFLDQMEALATTGGDQDGEDHMILDDLIDSDELLAQSTIARILRVKQKVTRNRAKESGEGDMGDGQAKVKKHAFTCLIRPSGWITKHRLVKPRTKGNGNTSCVLCPLEEFQQFLEEELLFHSFLHYSHILLFIATRGSCYNHWRV